MIFFIQSVILCALFTFAILFNMRDPIKSIMSYPTNIRRRVESLPQYQDSILQKEKAHIGIKLLSIPVITILLAMFCWMGGARTFFEAFLYGLGLFLVINLYDLIVLDWIWFCHSKRVRIPGTEDMVMEYRNPWYHLRGFGIGVGIGLVTSLLSAGIVVAYSMLIK